ncbi:MAG: hypothetical protein ACI9G1_002697 [Pirellulaceae bacterium]|jgi:hypothetical protein
MRIEGSINATRLVVRCLLLPLVLGMIVAESHAGDFDDFLKPLVVKNCIRCHGGEEVNGKIDFKEVMSESLFLQQPKLIKEMLEVVDANDMPPEGEPQLNEKERTKLLVTLKTLLRDATSGGEVSQANIRRLNRFQYNNAVKDIFQLKLDVFRLPEKLMTRQGNYLNSGSDKMPDRVNVTSHSLKPEAGLANVKAFPKDLRASHGFDNQANQLTLSPLLLDAFLRLSVSIVESPDFNEGNVGIWNEFFREPAAGSEMRTEVRTRLARFLRMTFRSSVDDATLDRYASYTLSKMDQGMSFTDAMKKVASAALSSPMFLYRTGASAEHRDPFDLASNLSFFLWASGPDLELLQLAENGELAKPETLDKEVDRMLADPKVERFLDTFPSQWMQLENVLAATPDPQKHRYFSLDKSNPASLQMVLEPLLLFDAVFIEDRPIVDLIAPDFGYQSDFLKTWYTSDLKPPMVDVTKVIEENRINDERRKQLTATIGEAEAELNGLIDPVRTKLLAARRTDPGAKQPVDLKPYAAWEFNGDLVDSFNRLNLKAHGNIKYVNGMVVLDNSHLLSETLPFDLKAKTLEVWCQLHNLDQSGGGAMGIQGPGDFFDTIVLGERKSRHWISGSNGFSRTLDFPESTPEETTNQVIHLVMVYQEDGTTTLYRNGKPYGKPYRKGAATFPKDNTSVIFGLRHLPPGGNKFLSVSVDSARLYDRALTAAEVESSSSGNNLFISDKDLLEALSPDQRLQKETLEKSLDQSAIALKNVPMPRDLNKLQQDEKQRFEDRIRGMLRSQTFERVAATDPRYGGVITNAAMLSMTSGPMRTHPIARGAWIIEVIFNDPPPPPPNDVPALNEDAGAKNLTIREKFAVHRENPVCAGCHSRLDPLGFSLENFDITGRWRDKYENGRVVDSSGRMMKKYEFDGIVQFKESLVKENKRFAKAFTAHLLRFAMAKELSPRDSLTIDSIVLKAEKQEFRLKSLIKEVVLSESFRP